MALHILVVDDRAEVRDVIVGMLNEHGHIATAAADGGIMRDILAAQGTPIDAVVLDALMPGEPTVDLALHLKALQIPVVVMSGSPEKVQFAEDMGLLFLHKPFRMNELIEAIDTAIASGRGPSGPLVGSPPMRPASRGSASPMSVIRAVARNGQSP